MGRFPFSPWNIKGVLGSCPASPGLSKSNWLVTIFILYVLRNWNQRGRYSSAELFWGLLPKVNTIVRPWGRLTCPISKSSSFLSLFYSCRVLPAGHSLLARLSWTHPWANSASAVASCAICILIQRGVQWIGLWRTFVLLIHALTN